MMWTPPRHSSPVNRMHGPATPFRPNVAHPRTMSTRTDIVTGASTYDQGQKAKLLIVAKVYSIYRLSVTSRHRLVQCTSSTRMLPQLTAQAKKCPCSSSLLKKVPGSWKTRFNGAVTRTRRLPSTSPPPRKEEKTSLTKRSLLTRASARTAGPRSPATDGE